MIPDLSSLIDPRVRKKPREVNSALNCIFRSRVTHDVWVPDTDPQNIVLRWKIVRKALTMAPSDGKQHNLRSGPGSSAYPPSSESQNSKESRKSKKVKPAKATGAGSAPTAINEPSDGDVEARSDGPVDDAIIPIASEVSESQQGDTLVEKSSTTGTPKIQRMGPYHKDFV